MTNKHKSIFTKESIIEAGRATNEDQRRVAEKANKLQREANQESE